MDGIGKEKGPEETGQYFLICRFTFFFCCCVNRVSSMPIAETNLSILLRPK